MKARSVPQYRRANASTGVTPQWVADLVDRNQAAMVRMDEIRGLQVPSEDHEWEDLGTAWPDELQRQRDAVIQPPKPEIKPAQPVAELAAEASGTRSADHEAGE